jgi:hypothetical protein
MSATYEPVDQSDGPRQKKRAPNRLLVDDSAGDGDNSCVMLSMARMEGTPLLAFF